MNLPLESPILREYSMLQSNLQIVFDKREALNNYSEPPNRFKSSRSLASLDSRTINDSPRFSRFPSSLLLRNSVHGKCTAEKARLRKKWRIVRWLAVKLRH